MAFFARPQSASSAVKIVKPATTDDKLKSQARKDSTQRQCRNILIYGSCKFQDKGCVYYHPSSPDTPQSTTTSTTRPESPSKSLTAHAVNAPVFVPKAASSTLISAASPPPASFTPQPQTIAAPLPTVFAPPPPSADAYQEQYQEHDQEHDPYDPYAYSPSNGDIQMDLDSLNTQIQGLDPNYYAQTTSDNPYTTSYNPSFQVHTTPRQPLLYHLYAPPPPLPTLSPSHFIDPSTLRSDLQTRSETTYSGFEGALNLNLPDELQGYHSLVPLENVGGERRKFGNWYSTVYRAVSIVDGSNVVLRRIENFRLMHQAAFGAIETWSRIRHPGIVSVREAFTTRAFNDNSLIISYTYHPTSTTLFSTHLKPKPPSFSHGKLQAQSTYIPEPVLWSYVVQLAGAIRKVHEEGLAVRMIDATKVILTGKNRIRISSCGIVDVLTYTSLSHPSQQQPDPTIHLHQQEDFAMLGRLLFALATNNMAAASNMGKTVEVVGRLYSTELKNIGLWLCGKGAMSKNIGHLFDMIGNRIGVEVDEALNAVDHLEGELMSELENARLVRLLCKFGFINERPEFAREPKWSETGDRYIIKLFRDYVFHQIDESGNPVVNLSHVLTCLNKLDAGTDERLMLISRDEQSCLVVSYKEVKSCVEAAFGDLARGSLVGT